MKIIFIIIWLYGIVSASVIDDYYTYKAQQYYTKGDLKHSFIDYEKIKTKSDAVLYNMANILYQTHNYEEAIILYEKITSLKLLKKKWYNLANCYTQMKQYSKAVYYYQKLLQTREDKDAKENLIFVQKQIQKQYLQILKKKKYSLKHKGKDQEGLYEDAKIVKVKMVEGKNSNIENKENLSHLVSKREKAKQYFKDLFSNIKLKILQNDVAKKFTSIEEKKWDKLLREKRIGSLVIPLNKKGVLDEDIRYPW